MHIRIVIACTYSKLRTFRFGSYYHCAVHICVDKIITINKCNPLASSNLYSTVACGRQACICLMNHLHPRVLLRIPVTDCRAAVRGAVVHKDQLKICERLAKNAVHALL